MKFVKINKKFWDFKKNAYFEKNFDNEIINNLFNN